MVPMSPGWCSSISPFGLASRIAATWEAKLVSFDRIDLMLRGEPVSEREARLVLQAASKQTRLYYKLSNVDVALSDGEGANKCG